MSQTEPFQQTGGNVRVSFPVWREWELFSTICWRNISKITTVGDRIVTEKKRKEKYIFWSEAGSIVSRLSRWGDACNLCMIIYWSLQTLRSCLSAFCEFLFASKMSLVALNLLQKCYEKTKVTVEISHALELLHCHALCIKILHYLYQLSPTMKETFFV